MADTPSALPEQTFFPDPALDRVMGVVFNLCTEVQVLRERVLALEGALNARGLVPAAVLEQFGTAPSEQAALGAQRQAFADHLLEPLLGRAASLSEGGSAHAA
jgi:hypothetical protein